MIEPIFQNEKVTLFQGDCLQILPQLNTVIDFCICDLPYGILQNCEWDIVIPFQPMWEQIERLIKIDGTICLFGKQPFSSKLRLSNLKNFRYDWIWEKSKGSNFLSVRNYPFQVHEIISVFYRKHGVYNPVMNTGKPFKNKAGKIGSSCQHFGTIDNPTFRHENSGTRYPRSVQYFPTAENEIKGKYKHPSRKPIALLEFLIKTYTNENEVVLDFTAGSGSTGIACMNTNRRCILIEKEPKYCEMIIDRLADHTQQRIAVKEPQNALQMEFFK